MVTKSRGTRLPSSQSPREVGVSWWRRSAENQRYVVASSEQPGGAASRFLRQEGYVVEVAGGKVWILKTPDRDDVRELCLANYWSIVRLILEQYMPARCGSTAASTSSTGADPSTEMRIAPPAA